LVSEIPISKRVLADMRPSTLESLASARNDVEFANQGGRYEDIRRLARL
jgi:hypothetical protein